MQSRYIDKVRKDCFLMNFSIIKSREKSDKLRQERAAAYREKNKLIGNLVSFRMPSYRDSFPKIRQALLESSHNKNFQNIDYYIETKGGNIKILTPASGYYKKAFKSISDMSYTMELSIGRINSILLSIKEQYQKTREVIEKTGQPSIKLNNEIYALKSEISVVLFISRGIFDVLATTVHFLYGPSSCQFISFVDYYKYLRKTASDKVINDPEMLHYIETNMQWFWILRDLRDYVTHVGSFDMSFYEQEDGQFKIYLRDSFREIVSLLNECLFGMKAYLDFFDEHFSKLVITNS